MILIKWLLTFLMLSLSSRLFLYYLEDVTKDLEIDLIPGYYILLYQINTVIFELSFVSAAITAIILIWKYLLV